MIGIDIEMPKSCMWCPLCDGEDWTCCVTYEICNGGTRPEHCPLHESVTANDNPHEIIRCKNCAHHTSLWYCEAWNNSPGFPVVGEDGYCWMAERKGEEDG